VVLTEPSNDVDRPSAGEDTPSETLPVGKKRRRTAKRAALAASRAAVVAVDEPVKDQVASGTTADEPQGSGTGNCTLNINSIPISHVSLDGHPLGLTPKTGVSV